MGSDSFSKIMNIFLVISIFVVVVIAVDSTGQKESEEVVYEINASEAELIISQDQIAQDYMSENFERPEWRAVSVSLLMNSTNELEDGKTYPLWDVKIMERTCACNSIKDLYVIEGQVSPTTGEIIDITAGLVLESKYDKQMCASTICH